MKLELEVALAYLRSKPSRLVSSVSLLSIAGIALGVAALVVAMGLLSGYRSEIREKLVGANAEGHIVAPDAAGAAVGVAFKAPKIERFTADEPMQPAGAALLRIAWEPRDVLLAG